jgi:hypothetical protein
MTEVIHQTPPGNRPKNPYIPPAPPSKEERSRDRDILILRRLLWLNHGHNISQLYSDDGEMQCSQCLAEYGFFDWERTPVDEIERRILEGNIKKQKGE